MFKSMMVYACCGRGSAPSAPAQARSRAVVPLATMRSPIEDQVQLRYTGRRAGNAPFYGTATHMQYRFGLAQPLGMVHAADAPALLRLTGIDTFEVQP